MTARPGYSYLDREGREVQLSARVFDPITLRWEALVDGIAVGRGFVSAEDALDRAAEFARTGA